MNSVCFNITTFIHALYSLCGETLFHSRFGIPDRRYLTSASARTEVYNAEIMGAVEGLRAVVSQDCTKFATQINILLDNLAAASLLADGRPAPYK